jgi:hypothetical protein
MPQRKLAARRRAHFPQLQGRLRPPFLLRHRHCTIAPEVFAMLAKVSPWKRTTALRKTVMYSLGFADGRTGYVVVPQELVEHGDQDVPSIARERQRRGEVPVGDIISVKRVR